jgi:hypothetical protein
MIGDECRDRYPVPLIAFPHFYWRKESTHIGPIQPNPQVRGRSSAKFRRGFSDCRYTVIVQLNYHCPTAAA